jgi:calcium-dependent protein kinase
MEGEEWERISDEAKDLIRKMIVNQETRMSASEVLQHPWLCNTNLNANIKLNVSGIKNFYQAEKFKRIALSALAFHSDTDVDQLGKVFNALDKDGDGHLSYDELITGLNSVLGGEAAELLSIYKANMKGDSKINYQGEYF